MIIYQILGWNDHFENNKSRERESCSFVCVPNKQDGMGFTRIMAEKDGASIYGIWILLLGIASRQSKPRAGWLTENGHQTGSALALSDFAILWRRSESEIERAINFLCSPKIGWLSATRRGVEPELKLESSALPAECPPSAKPEPAKVDPFDLFWHAYPRREAKGAAQKAWGKLKLDGTLTEILMALMWQVHCFDWKKEGGQFIPLPASYLNAKRWLDEPNTPQGRAVVVDKPAWLVEGEEMVQSMRSDSFVPVTVTTYRNEVLAGGREAVNWLNSTLDETERAFLISSWHVNHKWEIL
jgi:hypothetical protein